MKRYSTQRHLRRYRRRAAFKANAVALALILFVVIPLVGALGALIGLALHA